MTDQQTAYYHSKVTNPKEAWKKWAGFAQWIANRLIPGLNDHIRRAADLLPLPHYPLTMPLTLLRRGVASREEDSARPRVDAYGGDRPLYCTHLNLSGHTTHALATNVSRRERMTATHPNNVLLAAGLEIPCRDGLQGGSCFALLNTRRHMVGPNEMMCPICGTTRWVSYMVAPPLEHSLPRV